MEANFWHDKWSKGEIGFHQGSINSLMIDWWPKLGLSAQSRVLVPLAGKSLDMLWLAEQGHQVIGCELNADAVASFFNENGLSPSVEEVGDLTRYRAGSITLYAGDFFSLTPDLIGPLDGAYDRAATIALPPTMRREYARHLASLLPEGSQTLLISLEYENGVITAPPHCIPNDEVEALYGGDFTIQYRAREAAEVLGVKVEEVVYLLTRR